MEEQEKLQTSDQEEGTLPAVFRSWNHLYAFVLIMHGIILILFYLFTETYS